MDFNYSENCIKCDGNDAHLLKCLFHGTFKYGVMITLGITSIHVRIPWKAMREATRTSWAVSYLVMQSAGNPVRKAERSLYWTERRETIRTNQAAVPSTFILQCTHPLPNPILGGQLKAGVGWGGGEVGRGRVGQDGADMGAGQLSPASHLHTTCDGRKL